MYVKTANGRTMFLVKEHIVALENSQHGCRIYMRDGEKYLVGFPMTQVASVLGFTGPTLD